MIENAVQSASHNWPRLRRLLVKLGMMWPRCEFIIGILGKAKRVVAMDVWVMPVAVGHWDLCGIQQPWS